MQLAKEYCSFVVAANKPSHSLRYLLEWINAMTDGVTLSGFHTLYAWMSLKSLCYQQSLVIIDKSYVDVLPGTLGIDLLTYYYYSGVILMGLERYSSAID